MAFPTKATHQQTRVHNERLVVRTLYDHGPISRAEVARVTGLTRTTVSDVVGTLLGDGVVREIGRGPSSGGKAPILLEVDDDARLVVGLDLGEERFAGSLVNLRGEIRRTVELPVAGRDGSDALDLVFELLDRLLAGMTAPLLGIVIRVGRGVGAGLILRGALFQGDGSGAGEIGHVVVDDDGDVCRCGRTGCLETVVGMRAIEARAAAANGRPTDLSAVR